MGKNEMIECVKFVLSECSRFQGIIKNGDFRTIDRWDSWSSLPHPGGGELICGAAAIQKLIELANISVLRGNIVNNVSRETLIKEMRVEFSKRFIDQKASVDERQVDRLIGEVAKKSAAHCKTITHLIPCHLMHSKDPYVIEFGPVIFRSRSSIRKTFMRHRVKNAETHDDDKYVRRLKAQALSFYRNFRWVAEVTIKGCDRSTSERVASEAVTAGLNCLHLLVGANHSRRMRVGGLHLSRDRRAKIQIDEDGILNPSTSFARFGEIAFPDGWSEILGPNNECQKLLGVALESAVDPSLHRPLSKRFLDALYWFGEATRDDGDATRVIKYATALERLLMTGERDDIATTLSERIAALCIADKVSRSDRRSMARRVYDLRSKLVHGGVSPTAINLYKGVNEATELTEAALFYTLGAFGEEGLKDNLFKEKNLPKWFGMAIEWADKVEGSREF